MFNASSHAHRYLMAALVLACFAGRPENVFSCDTPDLRSSSQIEEDIEKAFECFSKKIADLERDAAPRMELLESQLDRATDTVGEARAVSSEAEFVANNARSSASRADANIEELNQKISTASRIVELLEGVEDFEEFLANNEQFQKKIAELVVSVPTGTVAAFDLKECPSGWMLFEEVAGRMIIGVGQGTNLSARQLRDTGGKETMTVDEMPAHRHRVVWTSRGRDHTISLNPSGTPDPNDVAVQVPNNGPNSGQVGRHIMTTEVGSGSPHNNMPPYIALTFCKKEGG